MSAPGHGRYQPADAEAFWEQHHRSRRPGPAYYPTPGEIAAELALDPEQWPVLRADMPQRRATGPGGRTAIVTGNVLLIQRVTQRAGA